jgi:hypothetical protein
MNLLLLSPWFPSPPFGGALIRVYETLASRRLIKEGVNGFAAESATSIAWTNTTRQYLEVCERLASR